MQQFASRKGPTGAAPEPSARASRPPAPTPVASLSAQTGGDFDLSGIPLRLQPKLILGEPDDPLEREADRAADAALRLPDGAAPASTRSTGFATVGENFAPNIVHRALASSGRPLDATTRAYFEPRFGHDFSGVRVHQEADAAASATAIGARAYTSGRNIVFANQEYAPASSRGRRLIAHELAHVVQQSTGGGDARTVHRQMDEDLDDDPILKALLGKTGDDPKKKLPTRDSFKSDFLNLKLPPEHEVTGIPKASQDKGSGLKAPEIGGYSLGGGQLPKIPQNIEELKESRQPGNGEIKKEISALGGYDAKSGAIGGGVKIRTPLSPFITSIGKKLRGLRHHHHEPNVEPENGVTQNPPAPSDKAADGDLLKFVHEAFARKKKPLFPDLDFGNAGAGSNMLLNKGAGMQNPGEPNLHLPEAEKQPGMDVKLFEEAGKKSDDKEGAGKPEKQGRYATLYGNVDVNSEEVTKGNFNNAVGNPTVGLTLRTTVQQIIALLRRKKKKKKPLVDPFE